MAISKKLHSAIYDSNNLNMKWKLALIDFLILYIYIYNCPTVIEAINNQYVWQVRALASFPKYQLCRLEIVHQVFIHPLQSSKHYIYYIIY